MDAESVLLNYSRQIDARLDEFLVPSPEIPESLTAAMRYAVLSPGKRVRPALCMASAHAAGGPREDALDAGCAIEFVHCFSLIHDDLPAIDDDRLRRGRPTTHVQFGEATAILAGDALFARSFEIIASSGDAAAQASQAIRILARASGPRGLVGGEMADILAEGRASSPEEVCSIHKRKTAALIEAACEIGAIFGGGGSASVAALAKFGRHAGLAFQISDDLLNELSTAAAIGKSAGSDRDRKKATYPAAFGVEVSKGLAQDEVSRALEAILGFDDKADDLRVFARYVIERLR